MLRTQIISIYLKRHKHEKPQNPLSFRLFSFFIMVGAQNTPLPHQPPFFSKNALILYIKTPQFIRIMAFYLSLYIVLQFLIQSELAFLRRFLNGNSNMRKFSTYRHFCYLYVAYSAIFLTCERISRHFYINSLHRHIHNRFLPKTSSAICNNHTVSFLLF